MARTQDEHHQLPAVRLAGVSVSRAALSRWRAPDPAAGRPDPAALVLRDVTLEVPRGEALVLLGNSGGGKSTLLRLLDRLVEPDAGTVEVLGRPLLAWPIAELRRTAVLVPQQPVLLGSTLREELLRPLVWAGRQASPERLAEVSRLLRLDDLDPEQPTSELSGGQRARLAVARALVLEPPLLLLDEPTASLDVQLARALLEELRAWLRERAITLVLTTHRPADAARIGDRVAFLLAGRLFGPYPARAALAPEELEPEVQAFLGTASAAAGGAPAGPDGRAATDR
ncbi:MAG: hypothetical protein KatS3mg102_2287 [Planctomycetota bacterium]|nr:MAG: hypothetical protein KatS3mg102_2287 [Planctomycetota bacterium]